MREIITSLNKNIMLINELSQIMPLGSFSSKLGNLPSNTIGEQFWCIVGARESYLKALENDKWMGFECSLDWELCCDKSAVKKALKDSGNNIKNFLDCNSDLNLELLINLLEHEVRHQGQLIRYVYGLKLNFPNSWKENFSLG